MALYMYMRLQGYPPEKITILTTYNGQKHLIRDVLNQRCARNPVFGLPSLVRLAGFLWKLAVVATWPLCVLPCR